MRVYECIYFFFVVMHHLNVYIYMYIVVYMVRNIKLEKGKIEFSDNFDLIFEKTVTKFGNGAKIDAPKELLGKKVYVVVRSS